MSEDVFGRLRRDVTDNREQIPDVALGTYDVTSPARNIVRPIGEAKTESFSKQAGRRVIVVVSDGEDTTSQVSLDQCLRTSQNSEAVLYALVRLRTGRWKS